MKRVLVRGLVALVALTAVGAGLVWLGLSSEAVARRLIAFGLARAGNDVTIERITGRLRGPLVLRGIAVHTEQLRATVDTVRLQWSPTGLIRRQVRIDQLYVTGVHVVLPDSASAKRDTVPPERPRLPMDVVLGDVVAREISVDAPGGVALRGGTVRLAGRAGDYRLDARGDASTPAIQAVHLALQGRGNLQRFSGARADVDLLDGRLSVTGSVSWWPKIGWDLVVVADRIRPARLLARPEGLPGTLSLHATTAGTLDSTGPAGRLLLDTLGGTLRRQPLGGRLAVRFADSVYRIDTLAVSWGSAGLTASGSVGDTVDLRYGLAVGDLGTALPGGAGRLTVAGTAAGPRTGARIRVRAEGRGLAMGPNQVAHLAGRAEVDLGPGGRNDVDLRADSARIAARAIDRIVLALRGSRRDHRATARMVTPDAEAAVALAGGLEGKEWKGRVDTVQVRGPGSAGAWELEQAAALSAAPAAAILEQLCLRSRSHAAARVCAGGAWRGANGWRAAATVEGLPLALADSLLPTGDSLTGTLQGRLDASAMGGRLDAGIRLATDHAALDYPDVADRKLRRVALDTAALEIRAGSDGVHGSVTLRASDSGHAAIGGFAAQVALPSYRRLGAPLQTQPVDARVDGRIDDLAVVQTFTRALDSIAGKVTLELTVGGTVGAPRGDGSVRLQNLAAWLPERRSVAGSVDATLRATVEQNRRVTADLRITPRDLRVAYVRDSTPQRLAVEGGGLQVHVGPDGVRGTLELGLSNADRARLASLSARLDLPQYTALGLPLRTQPVALRLTAEVPDLSVGQALVTGVDSLTGRAALELGVEGTGGAPRIDGKLRLENLVARLPQGTRVTGALSGDVRAAVASDSSLDAELRLIPHGLAVEYAGDDTPGRMTLDSTGLVVQAGRDGVRGSLDLRVRNPGGNQLAGLSGRLALPRYTKVGAPLSPQPVSAKLDGTVDDLSVARAFSAEVDSLAGRVSLDASLSGTAGKPQLVGGLRLQDVAANVPRLGLRLREVELTADGDQAGAVTIDGRLRSGTGLLTLQGRSPVRPTAKEPGRLHVQGDSVEAANTGEIHVLVSPRLDIALAGDSIDAQGEVRVPYAHVELSEVPPTAVPPSDDIVFTDTASARAARQRVTARVRVVLGDSVSFTGFNFKADLGGDLLAVAVPDRPATGSGAITIKAGHYKAYGQDLTISEGRIRFAGGPVDNPGLDIRATRTAEDSVVAGVQIRGTLKSPEVTIFSNPPMSQERALQYLVLGHPLGEGSGTQGNLASKAASTLGLRGGNVLARSVGQGVGLDQAGIETKGDLKQASFVAGKYLSPNLYLSYGIGLFDPVSTLRLRYVLSSRWTLQAEKGAATGADILYRVEAGR